MARFDRSGFELDPIPPLLPDMPSGVARGDDRRVLHGSFRLFRTGSPWRDLPEHFSPSTTIHNRFDRWAKAGVRVHAFKTLAQRWPASRNVIARSILRACQQAAARKGADHALGRSCDRPSPRINAMVDERGAAGGHHPLARTGFGHGAVGGTACPASASRAYNPARARDLRTRSTAGQRGAARPCDPACLTGPGP